MEKTLLFSIALVLCFGICIISAKKAIDFNFIPQTETGDNTPVDTAPNKEFHFKESGSEVTEADGKSCYNDTDCMYLGYCQSNGECDCPPGTYGTFCQYVRECIRNPKMCGNGTDVKCVFNPYKNRPACLCDDEKKKLNPFTKKCAEPCTKYVNHTYNPYVCGEYGDCKNGFCVCVKGVSGDWCEIFDKCASGEVNCSGDPSATCSPGTLDPYDVYCKCNKTYQDFDYEDRRCKGECRCENGKCMRRCDVDKTVPCMDDDMVCVCNPEHGKRSDLYCDYCDCGPGFNCTFNRFGEKKCICPEGFYDSRRSDDTNRCEVECSDELPCQNGGSCPTYKRCDCPKGTSGALCEKIPSCSECANSLEADCLYDPSKERGYCSCKNSSLYYDYDLNICKPCPCENGECEYANYYPYKELKCNCHSGYKELIVRCETCPCENGVCKYENDNPSKELECNCHYAYNKYKHYCKKCECGSGSTGECEIGPFGKTTCDCQDGYYEKNGHCLPCGCTMNSDLDTKCKMVDNVKRCFCKEGFQDVLGRCEDVNECETNNTCRQPAICHNTFGSFYCQCPEGYRGTNGSTIDTGNGCDDINECKELAVPCRLWENVMCVNLPGSYKCECLQGYKPESYHVEPCKTACVKTKKSWAPTVIVVFIVLVLIVVSALVLKYVKNRSSRPNSRIL